jgi:putative membrane protein
VIHCAFGLLLVYPMREILLRVPDVSRTAAGWLAWALVLAVSSVFEVIESIIAESVSPGTGPDWLGAQGDEWDAQQDMIMATLGAGFALLITWRRERGRWPDAPRLPENARPFSGRRFLHAMCAAYGIAWIIAAIHPVSRADWLLENLLVFAWVPVLVLTYPRRPLSDVSYALILGFFLLHTIGAHYTYSEVPIGYWLKDAFGMTRNHFDRIVHFSWGLLITYPLRDLTRLNRLRPFWAAVLPAMIIVSWSGFYELIEAVVAWLVSPELGQAYLGTQGDVWDGQWDMGLATIGSVIAMACTVIGEKISRRTV